MNGVAQRPEILFPLFKPVRSLSGVGPKLGALMAKITGDRIVDLCWHLPAGIVDRRFAPKIAEAPEEAHRSYLDEFLKELKNL